MIPLSTDSAALEKPMDPLSRPEEQLFEAARKLSDSAERDAFLRAACGGDLLLREGVEALLEGDASAEQFFADGAGALEESIAAESFTEKPGNRIGRYKLLQQLGEGGCGVVYMAEQEEPVRRRVALKIIKLGMDTKTVVARFEAERQALALMDHPNIAHVFDAGATDTGRPFFVMELVRGIKITDYCDQQRLSTAERLELFIQVCQAVQHAHQKGIIHRDLKPSNILVTINDGAPVPKVIDFGIAKATQGRLTDATLFTAFEQLLGTPAYMSPEQAVMTSVDVDTRSDIYSLGVLLYELLTGKTPFETEQLLSAGLDKMRQTIREEEPPPPSTRLKTLPGNELSTAAGMRRSDGPKLITLMRRDLDCVVMKCLEKDRARRYQTANALAMDLKRYLNNEPILARPATNLYRFKKFLARHTLAVLAGTAFALLLILGTTISFSEAFRARHAEAREIRHRDDAERSRARAEDLLGKLEMDNAEMLFSGNDSAPALASLARMLRANPSNGIAATRLISALTQRAFFLPTDVLLEHEGTITSIQFSQKSRIVTASLDGTAKVWDAASGTLLLQIRIGAPGSWASFSPDGSRIVTGSSYGAVRLWDALTGRRLNNLWDFSKEIVFADFSPDGKHLAVAGGSVHVFDVNSGESLFALPQGDPQCVRFSPEGTQIVTAGWDGTAQVWDAATGEPLGRPFNNGGARLWAAEFSPDGQRLLVAGSQFARIYDLATRRILLQTPTLSAETYSAEFTPDGSRVLVKTYDRRVWLFDAFTGACAGEPLHLSEFPKAIVLSPDGRRVALGQNENQARVWRVPVQGPGAMVFGGKESGTVKFSPDGKLVASGGGEGVSVYDIGTGKAAVLSIEDARHTWIAFSPDSQWVAAGSWSGLARVWNARTGSPRTPWLQHQAAVNSVQFSPDGTLLLTGSYLDRMARIWDAETGALLQTFRHPDQVMEARFSPDGKRIVTACHDGVARVWDAASGARLASTEKHKARLGGAEFSPDGRWIATASEDRTARIWDSWTGQPISAPIEHKEPVWHPQFSSDGHRVLLWGQSREVWLWEVPEGRAVVEPLQHSGYISSAFLSRDNERIVTSALDGGVRVWNSTRGQLTTETFSYGGLVLWADFNPDASAVAASCEDGAVRLWDVPKPPLPAPDWLPALAEGLVGHRFTTNGNQISVPAQELVSLRRRLAERGADDYYSRWATWFFADPEERSVTPSSNQHLPEYIAFLREKNTVASLRDALRLSPDDPKVMAQLGQLVMDQDPAENPWRDAESNWLIRRAVSLDPRQAAALSPLVKARLQAVAGSLSEGWSVLAKGVMIPAEIFLKAKHFTSLRAREPDNFALAFTGGAEESALLEHKKSLNAFPLTVEAWFCATNHSREPLGLVSKYAARSFNGWSLHLIHGELKAWYFSDSANRVWNMGLGLDGGPVADGRWHHAALVVDPTGGTLYLDGVAKEHLRWSGVPGPCSTIQPVTIGAIPGVPPPHFDGRIDEVRIWNISRSREEILADMRRSLRGDESGLVAYLRFDGNGRDESHHQNKAIVAGAKYLGAPPLTALGTQAGNSMEMLSKRTGD